MCGRFTQHWTWEQLLAAAETFWEGRMPATDPAPRYNVAPTQEALVVRRGTRGIGVGPARWGFAKPGGRPGEIIHARAETAGELATFRDALARRRCLVPVSGFFEWDRCGDGTAQPWHLTTDPPVIFLAALWRRADDAEGRPGFVIMTFPTPDGFEPAIHHRMPGVVRPGDAAAWLAPDLTDASAARRLARPFGSGDAPVRAWPVSTRVNSSRPDGPGLLEPVRPEPRLFG